MVTLIGLSGSLRRGSFNSSLLRAAAELVPEGVELSVATIRGIPLYDGDVEAANGVPAPVEALKDSIAAADGLLLRGFLEGYVKFVESTRRGRS